MKLSLNNTIKSDIKELGNHLSKKVFVREKTNKDQA